MQKCQVPISSGLALVFWDPIWVWPPLQSFGPGPCGLGHIHREITNFRCILLGEPSWKSFHGCWIVAKEHSSVSKQLLQPVFLGDFGRHLKRLNIFQYLHAVLELKCCNAHVCSSHYVWARILQNTWQSHFQYKSLLFMALGIFVFIFQANLQTSRVVFRTGLNLWTNMFPCFELFWPRAERAFDRRTKISWMTAHLRWVELHWPLLGKSTRPAAICDVMKPFI